MVAVLLHVLNIIIAAIVVFSTSSHDTLSVYFGRFNTNKKKNDALCVICINFICIAPKTVLK